MDFPKVLDASWDEKWNQDRSQEASKKRWKNGRHQDGHKMRIGGSSASRPQGSRALGRFPPKGLANPSPPGEKSPPPHFSTPFPSNPFPSSSFPFPSLRFPSLPLSWPVLACLGSFFLPNLAPTWLPKSTQTQIKWNLGGLSYLDLVF